MSLAELDEVGRSGPSEDFGRLPPQDLGAEQSVLGGMLLSKDAIADVVEALRGTDFYKPAHELVFDAVVSLYSRGEPADAVTVADELRRLGQLGQVGGPAYLHTLISSVPTAANAGYYARIVAERAVLRRLVAAGTRIVQLGYAAEGGDVEEIVNSAQAEVYAVADRRSSEDYVPIGEIIEGTMDEIEASSHRGEGLTGVPTGFADLDRLTNGLHAGQMVVIAARPAVGKSTLGLDIARAAALHHDLTTVIFSLEMGKNEIVMRLLSAEARIPLQDLRKGTIREEHWTKLARTMGDVSDKPLFIDDSPNMTLMEIRAKCRRLKQRNGLKLVILDYLQLMTSGKRVESRQQEVSEFSRALKLLAKELEVPVIALSQLNRGPEQRTDKRPMVSDLRESGCLTADTRVLRADTGAETTMGELFASGARDVPVWALDERLKYVRRHLTHVFSTGVKPVFRLRLASGREVRATANHPFLTYDGWAPLERLAVGDRVATPRHVCAPQRVTAWEDRQVVALADAIGAGSMRLTHGGRVPAAAWMGGLGRFGRRGADTFVPDAVFGLPKEQIVLFLRHLWACDGAVRVQPATAGGSGPVGRVSYTSTSRRLVDDVSRLLWRFGIQSRVARVAGSAGHRDTWVLDVPEPGDQKAFCRVIGVHGRRGQCAQRLLSVLDAAPAAPHVETVPREVWDRVRQALGERGGRGERGVERALAGSGAAGRRVARTVAPARHRLARVAEILQEERLEMLATNDVTWDEIVAIEPDGVEAVYDATVAGAHNFVANGIAVHNSIEQDADMVILLHREDMYEKESPRAGEADFIVAKHRNGPTDTIAVAFQGQYSRFVDMPN